VPTPHSAAVDFAKQPAHVDDALCVGCVFLAGDKCFGKNRDRDGQFRCKSSLASCRVKIVDFSGKSSV
jgi:hypothetical protein